MTRLRSLVVALLVMALVVVVVLQAGGSDRSAGAATSTLTPVADTSVSQSAPSTRYGNRQQLNVDGSPVLQTFVRFDLASVPASLSTAKLRLHVDDVSGAQSPAGGTVASSSNVSWSESTTNWNSRPTVNGATLATLGAVARNTWVEVDVSAFVASRAGGKVTFALTSTNTDGADYDSPETGATAPQLVVTTAAATTTAAPTTTTTAPPTTTTTTVPPAAPVTLAATADTYVEDAASTTNFGGSTQLAVDASPVRELLLRFDLSAVSGPVQNARLRLHVANVSNGGSPAGGAASRVDDTTWVENSVTWNNRPTAWGPVGNGYGAVTANTWVELDVTSLVAAGQLNTLGLRSTNADGAYYDSRESGANGPQLVVTTGTPPPTVTGITIAAVGDAACTPGSATTASACRQLQVASQLAADATVTQVLVLGDLQYENGELAGFQTSYDASYGQVKAKTRPVPGNHEYNTPGATGYYTYFGAAAGDPTKGYYSFDVGTQWHVVALNSNCSAVACAAGSTQEQWLRADLAASGRQCTIAFWHHPRFSSGSHGDATTVAPLWSALADAGAEMVLTGHDHLYERFDPQTASGVADPTGIREFVVGTGGRSLYGFGTPHANSIQRISTFGYLKLVLGDSAYSWQFVAEGGAVLDSGTGACH